MCDSRRMAGPLSAIIAAHPLDTISQVLDCLDAVQAVLPEGDGLRWFNQLYRSMTCAVRDAVAGGTFEDPEFLTTLDVRFARLYFGAVAGADGGDGAVVPRAWQALFDARFKTDVAPVQFALAGANAHINRDLMVALVDSFGATGEEPEDASAIHRDYQRVDGILAQVEAEEKPKLEGAWLRIIDQASFHTDDLFELWSMAEARRAAWSHATLLWALRDDASQTQRYVDTIDKMVGFAGRGLLFFG